MAINLHNITIKANVSVTNSPQTNPIHPLKRWKWSVSFTMILYVTNLRVDFGGIMLRHKERISKLKNNHQLLPLVV